MNTHIGIIITLQTLLAAPLINASEVEFKAQQAAKSKMAAAAVAQGGQRIGESIFKTAPSEKELLLVAKQIQADLDKANYILFKKKHGIGTGLPPELVEKISSYADVKIRRSQHILQGDCPLAYLSSSGATKIASLEKGHIYIHDVQTGSLEKILVLEDRNLFCLEKYHNSANKIQLVAASKYKVYVCDPDSGECEQEFSFIGNGSQDYFIEKLTLYTERDGHTRIAVAGCNNKNQRKLFICNTHTAAFEHAMKINRLVRNEHDLADIIAFTTYKKPSGEVVLVSASYDGTVRIWDTRERTNFPLFIGDRSIYALDTYTPNDGIPRLVLSCDDGYIYIWNTQDPQHKNDIQLISKDNGFVVHLTHFKGSNACMRIVSTEHLGGFSTKSVMRIWNTQTGSCEQVIKGLDSAHTPIVFTDSDGIIKIAYASNQCLCIWNTQKEQCEEILEGHTDWITKIIPCGRTTLATSSDDGTLRIWKKGDVILDDKRSLLTKMFASIKQLFNSETQR